MATLNNPGNAGGHRHDGQANYPNSNERNRDHARNATRDREYSDYDEKLTNDAEFQNGKMQEDADLRDKSQNLEGLENTNS